ncbi:hypothetical protein BB560_003365, partial [Smittium megazygosporum]
TLSKYGTVKDASARFVRGTSTMVPFGMKILFAKNSEKDMPNFIKVQKSRVGMFWRGCTPSCNYRKKYGHWKSECPEILQKNQNKKFQKQKTQPKNMTTGVPIQREISDVEPKSANVDTNKSESAKDIVMESKEMKSKDIEIHLILEVKSKMTAEAKKKAKEPAPEIASTEKAINWMKLEKMGRLALEYKILQANVPPTEIDMYLAKRFVSQIVLNPDEQYQRSLDAEPRVASYTPPPQKIPFTNVA